MVQYEISRNLSSLGSYLKLQLNLNISVKLSLLKICKKMVYTSPAHTTEVLSSYYVNAFLAIPTDIKPFGTHSEASIFSAPSVV